MKKFVKLSLAAAVASTGLVSANAGALEDAIKNTTIAGYASYRYDDRNLDVSNNTSYNDQQNNLHKVAVVLTSKINDNISYTYTGAVGLFATDANAVANQGAGLNYLNGDLYTVYNYFTFTGLEGVTINVGQQTIDVAQSDTFDDIAATQEGTGISAVTNLGGVTLAAVAFNQTKLAGEGADAAITAAGQATNLYGIVAKGKVGSVALDANYITLDDVAQSFTVGAKTSVDLDAAKISLKARYTGMDLTDAGLGDQGLWYVGAAAKMGPIGLSADYIATAKDGGRVAFDDDAEAVNQGWALNLNDTNVKGDMIKVGASYAVNSAYTLSAMHVAKSMDAANTDADETFGQLTWKPSKNFYAYLRYGVVSSDVATAEGERGRVHMTYNF